MSGQDGNRKWKQIVINWSTLSATSDTLWLGGGCFGTLLAPPALNTLTLQIKTDVDPSKVSENPRYGLTTPSDFDNISLLTTPKTLATGANAFSADEIREAGAAGPVKFVLSSTVPAGTQAVLWWKD